MRVCKNIPIKFFSVKHYKVSSIILSHSWQLLMYSRLLEKIKIEHELLYYTLQSVSHICSFRPMILFA